MRQILKTSSVNWHLTIRLTKLIVQERALALGGIINELQVSELLNLQRFL